MPRPTDWNVLGLGGDPTAGDPARIDEVVTSIRNLGQTAREVDNGLAAVLEKNGEDAFVGATADALREKISGRLRGFVQSIAEAFEWSSAALNTYVGVMRDEQWRADNALNQARGLPDGDAQKDSLKATAKAAGEAQSRAATTATAEIRRAYNNIKQPVDACEEFWEIFKWIAIALILPALIFGGPVALLAIGVNLVLFIKTAVDFANGKASALEFFLSALGILAPTTRAVPVFQLIKAGAQATWKGIQKGAFAVFQFFKNGFRQVISHPFVLFPGLRDLVHVSGSWVKGGGLWVRGGLGQLPALAGTFVSKAGLTVVNGIKGIPAFAATIPPAMRSFGSSTVTFLNREFGGNRWLRLFLPAEADELYMGVWKATRLAVVDRGFQGKHIFGLPKPHVFLPEQSVDPVSLRMTELRSGGLAAPSHLSMPQLGSLDRLGSFDPPSLNVFTAFGDSFTYSGDAVRGFDALVDSPVGNLSQLRIGEWADRGGSSLAGTDRALGVSSTVHIPSTSFRGLDLATGPAVSHSFTAPTGVGAHLTDFTGSAVGAQHISMDLGSSTIKQLTAPPPLGVTAIHAAPAPVVHATGTADNLVDLGSFSTAGKLAGPSPSAQFHALDLVKGADTTSAHALGSISTPTAGRIADATSGVAGAQHVALDLGAATVRQAPAPSASTPAVTATGHTGPLSTVDDLTSTGVRAAPSPSPVTRTTSGPPPTVQSMIVSPGGMTTHAGPPPTALTQAPPPSAALVQAGPPPASVHQLVVSGPVTHSPAGPAPVAHSSAVPSNDLGVVRSGQRPTGAELDAAWRRDSDLRADLFGKADDPSRQHKLETWAGYEKARGDLGRLEGEWNALRDRVGESSKGPGPYEIAVGKAYDAAVLRVDRIERDLHKLGINPSSMDARLTRITMDSLKERPRLLGGGGNTSKVAAEAPAVTVQLADTGRRVEVTGTDGAVTLRVVDGDGDPVPGLTAMPHGNGFQVIESGGGFRRYDVDGNVTATGVPFRELDGGLAPEGTIVTQAGTGARGFETPAGFQAIDLGNGRFQLNGVDGFRRFGADGALLETGRPLGVAADGTLVTTTTGVRTLETPPGLTVTRLDNGYQVGDATGFRRYDTDGAHLSTGSPLRNADGSTSHLVTPVSGPGHVEAPPGLTVTMRADGFDIGDAAQFRRFGADGTATATGTVLRDAGGNPLPGRFAVRPEGGGPVRIETGAGFRTAPHGGGFQVTDTATTGFHRFDANGGLASTGRPLPHAGDGHLVTNAAGVRTVEAGPGLTLTRVDDSHQVGDATGFRRYDDNGVHVSTGAPLRNGDGSPAGDGHLVTAANGDRHLEPAPGLTVTPHGGAYQVGDAAQFRRFGADGTATANGTVLRDAGGNPLPGRFAVRAEGGGPVHLEAGAGFRIDPRAGGGFQVTDTATTAFHRFDANGAHVAHGVPLGNAAGRSGGDFVVAGAGASRVETRLGDNLPGLTVTPRAGGGFRVGDTLGVRNGEWRDFDAAGALEHQSYNLVRNGRATGDAFVVDVGNGSWRLHQGGTPVNGGHHFTHGKIDTAGADHGRIRLTTENRVEVFDRRMIPGGSTLDMVRRFGDDFGKTGQRPHWTEISTQGTVVDHGVRRFDTDAAGWRNISHDGAVKHEIRTAIGKGDVVGIRGPIGHWTWNRFDEHGARVGHGTRELQTGGGWTDKVTGGGIAQRQHSMLHGPDTAGLYKQFDLDGAGVPQNTWKSQSPHGKDMGKVDTLSNGNRLETSRWTEQRPPQWVRNMIKEGNTVFDTHRFLRTDTKFQIFKWTETTPGGVSANGLRFVGMNDSFYDFNSVGRLIRYEGKLDNGNTLKVGDNLFAAPPARPPGGRLPWTEGNGKLSGYRVDVPPGGPHPGRVWEDRFQAAGGQWRVARAGMDDGTVIHYERPPAVGAASDDIATRSQAFEGTGAWTRKDMHGQIVGRSDRWPGGHRIEANGPSSEGKWNWSGYDARTDSRRWTWTDHNAGPGQPANGIREYGRGFNGPHTTFDDSFRDTARIGDLDHPVRERRMLDGGGYVDSWRTADAAGGGHHWEWRKIDKHGRIVDYGAGQTTRQWLDPGTGTWQADWAAGASRWRDVAPNGATVREIPEHSISGRVREYAAGDTNLTVTQGVWKEFDLGTIVRERKRFGTGFLESEAWRSQWRQYDVNGIVVARRTDNGYVYQGDRIVGRELDYRGPVTEIRGWNRRIREAQRMPFGGTAGIGATAEALYTPYWKLAMQKFGMEFTQEFLLEFAANIGVNAIVDAINGTQFNGKDVLKAFANAAVGAGIKTSAGALVHDNRFGPLQRTGDLKSGLANIDGGKSWYRKPLNHDKHWGNEWAGNEVATRWRGGTYDFGFNIPVTALTGFVNGAMNANVFGITTANGETVYLTGMAAVHEGGLAAAAGVTGAVTSGILKAGFFSGLGGRAFHRQGVAEFAFQLPWRIAEKTLTSTLLKEFRMHDNPWYYAA
ncbi:hypothetical protein [Catenuloplanes japonicus]|uniref:hypothetical protein n=1 Tax=Catenuloplanes japonicus TaxID=33876 RepID=UPI0005254CB1|nr:hypothetical protein [Catenuloplanes japonicus]